MIFLFVVCLLVILAVLCCCCQAKRKNKIMLFMFSGLMKKGEKKEKKKCRKTHGRIKHSNERKKEKKHIQNISSNIIKTSIALFWCFLKKTS